MTWPEDFVNGLVDENETNPTLVDTDADGLADGIEDANTNGIREADEATGYLIDSDGGGESDGAELVNGRDPLNHIVMTRVTTRSTVTATVALILLKTSTQMEDEMMEKLTREAGGY